MENKGAYLSTFTVVVLAFLVTFGQTTMTNTFNIKVTGSRKAIDKIHDLIIGQRIAKLKDLQSRIKTDKQLARLVMDRHIRGRVARKLKPVKKILAASQFKLLQLHFDIGETLIETRAIYSIPLKQLFTAVVTARRLRIFDANLSLLATTPFAPSNVKVSAFSMDLRKTIFYTIDDSGTLRSFNITLGNSTFIQALNEIKVESEVFELHGFDSKVALRNKNALSLTH